VRGCPRLSSLNLSGVRQCDDRALAEISKHARALRKLRIGDCELVSDAGLRSLGGSGHAHQFELLDLSRCARVSDEGVIALVDGFSSLERRRGSRHSNDNGEEDDLDRYRRTPALAHLLLPGCQLVTQDAVVRLASSCPLLLTLSLQVCFLS
jgi:F-box and leucine-rich repeat protein GRR1